MNPNYETVREFLKRLGHPVALIGRKPIDRAPDTTVFWPCEQEDPADQACWLSQQYHAVYCNLNPLKHYILRLTPSQGRSVADNMIARRTRVLIDIDGHQAPKRLAEEQKDALKAMFNGPLIETDSGNGYGLIYTCDVPNDEAAKYQVKQFLQQLNQQFSCVDTSVYGAGRLTRVIGTLNRSIVDRSRIPSLLLN